MDHIAIDLGGRKSRICVRNAQGLVVDEQWWVTSRLGDYLKKRPVSRVVLETSAEAFAIADAAKELGHEVVVVPAKLVKSLGVGARRVHRVAQNGGTPSSVRRRTGTGPV